MEKPEIIWKDRKRYFGLPISFTKYSIGEDRLFVEKGFFTTKFDEVLLYRIRDISLTITLGQKLFGVGTVTVYSSDKSIPSLELKNVKKPREVKEILHREVEAMKMKKRMRVNEILDNPYDDDGQGEGDGEFDDLYEDNNL